MNVEYVTIYPDGYETSETITAEQALSSAIKHDGDCVFELDSPGEYSGIPASVMMHVRDVQISRITDGKHQIALSLPVAAYYTLKKVIVLDRAKGLPLTGLYHDRHRNVIWYSKTIDHYTLLGDANCDPVGGDYEPAPPFTPILNEFEIKD